MSICESCHGGCCRSFAVPVTGADILRIERELGLDFWEFVCRWADPEGLIARNHAPHFYFEDEPGTPFAICLKHETSTTFPRTTKCRFLVECPPEDAHPHGTARCGIYGQRPAACRAFPMKLSESGDLGVLYDVPAQGRPVDNPAYRLCPRPWEPEDVDPIGSVQELVVARYEMAFFHHLADAWNRRRQSWAAFPDFLRLVYANRVTREKPQHAAEPDEPGPRAFPSPPAERSSLKAA